jgi:hypothetical protein
VIFISSFGTKIGAHDFNLDIRAGFSYVPNLSHPISKKFGVGPILSFNYDFFKYLRFGLETSLPSLISTRAFRRPSIDALPWVVTAYLATPFAIELENSLLVPYIKLPLGVALGSNSLAMVTGISSGLNWFFSKHCGLNVEVGTSLFVIHQLTAKLNASTGIVFRF